MRKENGKTRSSLACRICSTDAPLFFRKTILQKYQVAYFKCPACGFLFTEPPYWLNEAYSSAISSLDIGLVARNLDFAKILSFWLGRTYPTTSARFLDYAGGYGLLTRLLRDQGFNFYRQDKYCENIFALNYDMTDLNESKPRFDVVSALEVFEHFADPLTEIQNLFRFSDTIFFSTNLTPPDPSIQNWWYLSPETGQHISFFSRPSLTYIAQLFGARLFTNGHEMHILTRSSHLTDPFPEIRRKFAPHFFARVRRRIKKVFGFSHDKVRSLTETDHKEALERLIARRTKAKKK